MWTKTQSNEVKYCWSFGLICPIMKSIFVVLLLCCLVSWRQMDHIMCLDRGEANGYNCLRQCGCTSASVWAAPLHHYIYINLFYVFISIFFKIDLNTETLYRRVETIQAVLHFYFFYILMFMYEVYLHITCIWWDANWEMFLLHPGSMLRCSFVFFNHIRQLQTGYTLSIREGHFGLELFVNYRCRCYCILKTVSLKSK